MAHRRIIWHYTQTGCGTPETRIVRRSRRPIAANRGRHARSNGESAPPRPRPHEGSDHVSTLATLLCVLGSSPRLRRPRNPGGGSRALLETLRRLPSAMANELPGPGCPDKPVHHHQNHVRDRRGQPGRRLGWRSSSATTPWTRAEQPRIVLQPGPASGDSRVVAAEASASVWGGGPTPSSCARRSAARGCACGRRAGRCGTKPTAGYVLRNGPFLRRSWTAITDGGCRCGSRWKPRTALRDATSDPDSIARRVRRRASASELPLRFLGAQPRRRTEDAE